MHGCQRVGVGIIPCCAVLESGLAGFLNGCHLQWK